MDVSTVTKIRSDKIFGQLQGNYTIIFLADSISKLSVPRYLDPEISLLPCCAAIGIFCYL
jgi:hypothetical protein